MFGLCRGCSHREMPGRGPCGGAPGRACSVGRELRPAVPDLHTVVIDRRCVKGGRQTQGKSDPVNRGRRRRS